MNVPQLSNVTARIREWMRWDDPRLPLGKRGERQAARMLARQGMKIVAQNESTSHGEIDIVAVDKNIVVFVEVKTRRHHNAGNPLEAVDERKQRQLTQLALQFMKRHGLLETPTRFDVVGVTWPDENSQPTLTHIKDAFRSESQGQMFG